MPHRRVKCWLIVADSAHARLFEEAAPGVLVEREALSDPEKPQTRDHMFSAHDRMGPGSHAMESRQSPKEAQAAKFLERVIAAVTARVDAGEAQSLAVMAPPAALGALRAAWPDRVVQRIQWQEAKDRTHATVEDLAAALKDLRLP